ncbi:hypothetical protein BgiMline_027907 [Biomphalaria glabrata]|nr:hypothetical protein BgiMline_013768 [Biomphalaria glabrata]
MESMFKVEQLVYWKTMADMLRQVQKTGQVQGQVRFDSYRLPTSSRSLSVSMFVILASVNICPCYHFK